ncbi:MAG TPA: hypothetical protein VK698_17710 [Kofleriaceae bacterium]|nr:hypothetical protein [Kofleriaceae bacterium]
MMSGRTSTRTGRLCLAAALGAAIAGCGKSKDSGAAARPEGPAVHVVVSIDWEGAYFRSEALDALELFRKDNPGVPITHMLNAAYYTKPQADPAEATKEMRIAVKHGDDTGLHVHAWKSLVAAAGVTPKLTPSFLSRTNELLPFEDDTGFDVDLSAYSVAELRSILRKSRQLIEAQKLPLGSSFRAAGWLGTPNVLEAARAEGFTIDTSATDPAWLDEPETPYLQERLRVLWVKINQTTQPFWIDTQAGRILEMPDSGALADYTTVLEIEGHVERAAAAVKASKKSIIVHLGFHAETADDFAPRLSEALSRLRGKGTPMVFDTVSTAAELARRELSPAAR